jgi:hypothetical protein
MAKEQYLTNRDLTAQLVPSPDADFAEAIYPFAMSYLGYRVWGDQEACWATGGRDWNRLEQRGRVPASLTKIRTALFAAGRVMRFTDFDEDVAWDPSTFPEGAATGTDAPGSGAVWEAHMRELVAAIAIEVTSGPRAHRTMARAVASALDELAGSDGVNERASASR